MARKKASEASIVSALHFVKGALGAKEGDLAMTHFRIKDERITSYNGKMALSAPIPLNIDCCPKASTFSKAIDACEETGNMTLTPNKKLSVRSGTFRVIIDTMDEQFYPWLEPTGEWVHEPGVLHTFTKLFPFISEDDQRPWACGILLDGGSAMATNNKVVGECWMGKHFPYRVCVPRHAVRELIRIGEEPISVQVCGHSITFYFSGERYLLLQA